MSYTVEIKDAIANEKLALTNEEPTENPSSTELFSYAFCCAAQGLVWAGYLVLLLAPFAIRQGIFSTP